MRERTASSSLEFPLAHQTPASASPAGHTGQERAASFALSVGRPGLCPRSHPPSLLVFILVYEAFSGHQIRVRSGFPSHRAGPN